MGVCFLSVRVIEGTFGEKAKPGVETRVGLIGQLSNLGAQLRDIPDADALRVSQVCQGLYERAHEPRSGYWELKVRINCQV